MEILVDCNISDYLIELTFTLYFKLYIIIWLDMQIGTFLTQFTCWQHNL